MKGFVAGSYDKREVGQCLNNLGTDRRYSGNKEIWERMQAWWELDSPEGLRAPEEGKGVLYLCLQFCYIMY